MPDFIHIRVCFEPNLEFALQIQNSQSTVYAIFWSYKYQVCEWAASTGVIFNWDFSLCQEHLLESQGPSAISWPCYQCCFIDFPLWASSEPDYHFNYWFDSSYNRYQCTNKSRSDILCWSSMNRLINYFMVSWADYDVVARWRDSIFVGNLRTRFRDWVISCRYHAHDVRVKMCCSKTLVKGIWATSWLKSSVF